MDDAPADFENAFFEDAYDNAILYVPTGTLAAYQATATWGRFKDIREFDTTGIDDVVCEDDMLVENLSGGVVVPNAIGKDLTVYTPSGKLVERISSYKGQTVALEKGLYIIRTGNGVTKMLVR